MKPCPFCGGKAVVFMNTNHYGGSYGSVNYDVGVGCSNKVCPVKPRVVINTGITRGDAKELWDKREIEEKK